MRNTTVPLDIGAKIELVVENKKVILQVVDVRPYNEHLEEDVTLASEAWCEGSRTTRIMTQGQKNSSAITR